MPLPDRLKRIDEHHDIQQQAIPYPEDQNGLGRQEQPERLPKPQLVRDQKTKAATRNIGERIYYRIAIIIQRDRRLAIAVNDIVGVLDNLPRSFDNDRDEEPPGYVNLPEYQSNHPEFHEPVKYVRE